jgi:hypothetical protein
MPFIFNSEAGVGTNKDLTPLNNRKYFLIEMSIMNMPGKTRKSIEKYFNKTDLMSRGL